jgi:hypothetical protein
MKLGFGVFTNWKDILKDDPPLFALHRLEAKPEYAQAFKFIKNCTSKPWPPHCLKAQAKVLEREVLVTLCQHIFVPLSRPDEVFVENGYTQYLSTRGPEGAGLQTAIIGLGSFNTWHGTPDVRVRGTEISPSFRGRP